MASRPTYTGVPSRAQAEIAARRQRVENVEAAALPPPAPPPSLVPLSMEQRLKAMEKQMAALVNKVDLIIEILSAGEPPGADPPQPSSSKKRR